MEKKNEKIAHSLEQEDSENNLEKIDPFSGFHSAITLNDRNAFKRILKEKPGSLDAVCTFWKERPLHLAAIQNDPYMLKKLIQKGALLNEQNMLGQTALHHTVEQNKIRNVKLLLSQPSIDTHIKNDEGKTALELAKQLGHSMAGKMIITHCGLYTKHGLIAHEGLCQKMPREIACAIASWLLK